MEERNCNWFSELLWVIGSNARNSIPNSSWCWRGLWLCRFRGYVWDRPRWGTHHARSGSQSEVKPPTAPAGGGSAGGAVFWVGMSTVRPSWVGSWVLNCLWLFISNEFQNWGRHLLITRLPKPLQKQREIRFLTYMIWVIQFFTSFTCLNFPSELGRNFWNALELK